MRKGRQGEGRTWHREKDREELYRKKEGTEGKRVGVIALCVGIYMSGYINKFLRQVCMYRYIYMQSTTDFVHVHSTRIQVYITLPLVSRLSFSE